mmetsp:Transcript_1237/g.3816  ORF Transcript_1237/g.3816 Transcript_1237/m.3816 type:complete len:138 (+) Transcript_1237:9-422(+)
MSSPTTRVPPAHAPTASQKWRNLPAMICSWDLTSIRPTLRYSVTCIVIVPLQMAWLVHLCSHIYALLVPMLRLSAAFLHSCSVAKDLHLLHNSATGMIDIALATRHSWARRAHCLKVPQSLPPRLPAVAGAQLRCTE